MRLILLFGLLLSFQTSQAYLQCTYVFQRAENKIVVHQQHDLLVNMIKANPTDRMVVFAKYKNLTVREFLDLNLAVQKKQLEDFSQTQFSNMDRGTKDYYRELLIEAVRNAEREVINIVENENHGLVKMENLIQPIEGLEVLQSEVISVITRTNAILAEFLAALTFPKVMSTERTVEELIQSEAIQLPKDFRRRFSQEEMASLMSKKMDVSSHDGTSTLWIEVKYLGRFKDYNSVSGSGVFTKLKNIKSIAGYANKRMRILLVTVGPGKLTPKTKKQYEDQGIEVYSLTPDWN